MDTPSDKDRIRFKEGIDLVRDKKFEEAFSYFSEAVKLNPKSALAYAYRGKCNLAHQNVYSALFNFSQALSFDNTLAECYLDKGKIHLELLEFKEAFHEFDKAVWFFRGESAEAHRLRGTARLRMQQFSQSERDFLRAVELGDEDSRYILTQAPFYKSLTT